MPKHAHGGERGPEFQKWLSNIRGHVRRAKSSYVHKQANVVGRIVMEDHVHVAAGSSVRADEGAPFFIGANTNIQDGVVIHALKDKFVRVKGDDWAVYVGKSVSIAHDALVHGPCFVGDHTFIGFKAVVHDSIVGPHCFIGIGAVVVGVEVPEGRFVPHGTIVDTAEKAAALPPVSEAQHAFNEDVVEVNRGLAEAYARQGGRQSPRVRLTSQVRRIDASKEAGWFPPARSNSRF
jgi:SulP family sulfate permease